MTYKTYEITAFAESDLLSGGDGNLNCGDKFTMPGDATICISVKDNDSFLSGDSRCNENANDRYGQQAEIIGEDGTDLGNGGQIYAESYFWVSDQNGNWYVMIEVEQEGTNDDYFTFYTGGGYSLPPEGAELTVGSKCNVKGNWVDYKCLDAGDKPEDDPWDFNEETCTYTVEAESWDLHNFHKVDGDQASGGELVKISGHDGKISTDFGGTDGVYNMTICVQDECDGNSKLKVYVNGEFQQTIILDSGADGWGSNNGGFSEVTLQGLEIAEGDKVEIRAWRGGDEYVRIDAIKFEQVKFEECDEPGAVKLDFENFATGDILGTQIDGVTISAMGGSGDAMIFDSQNPTGGDGDLETQVAQLGNVLIVSEDGDKNDPDDAIGGKITFEFEAPSSIFDLKVIDTEEGGTITLTLEDGSTQTFDIPNLVNGGVGQVVMDVADVVRMDVQLNGSGAIDDLCYVPGDAQEPLGSLSGRYFCDDDRDGLDNDGANNGIEGVLVELLDENGNGTGITTTTDANGDYSFIDLAAGTYGVKFTDEVSGKELTTQNVDNDVSDDIDSDAGDIGGGMSVINGIVVVAGENTPDNDAGVVELPGALSGTYFCDDDRDGVDDGAAGGDADIAGKTVMLFEADGVTPATDIDGNAIASVQTDAEGNYRFDNLGARDYVVKFEATEGKEFIAQDVGNDDTIDSDVDPSNGMTAPVTVVAGQETKDVDAGVQDLLGSLSGRYFCDDDEDGLDNDGADNGIEGVTVTLLDANGDPVLDGGGTPRTTTTDAQGNYSFAGLVAATYGVMFADAVSGKELTTQNVDNDASDDIDSDASDLGGGESLIEGIVVVAGQNTPDNDAGVIEPNNDPNATDDAGLGCADDLITVDLSDNFSDPDGDAAMITMIGAENIADGQTVLLDGTATTDGGTLDFTGLEVTRNGDEFIFDAEDAFAALDIGESATANISFKVEDGEGGSTTANIALTIKGDANSVDSFSAALPAGGTYELEYAADEASPFPEYAFDLRFLDTGDARFDGVLFEEAYCLDFNTAVRTLGENGPDNVGAIFGSQSAAALDAFDPNTVSNANGLPGAENLDLINWVIAQNFEDQGFSGWEVQFAVWELADNFDASAVNYGAFQDSDAASVQSIVDAALAQGEGFEFAVGDTIGVIVDPGTSDADNIQPFIVGVDWEEYDCIC